MLDSTSRARLAGCLPDLQDAAAQLHAAALAQLGFGFAVPAYGGLRTEADQAQLVKWRDETVAAGGAYYAVAPYGSSRHEKGGAFDGLPDGAHQGDASDPRLAQLGALGESLGLTWGGRWSGKKNDPWHFELPMSWSELGDAFAALTRGDLQPGTTLASEALSAAGDAVSQNPIAAGGAGLAVAAVVVALFFLLR